MPPFCRILTGVDGSTIVDEPPMLMIKSLCYDAVIAAT
jgi:hypothetical protein